MGFRRLGKLSPPKNQEETSVRWVLTSQQKMVFSNTSSVAILLVFHFFVLDSFWTNLKPSYWFFWPPLRNVVTSCFATRIPSTVTVSDAPKRWSATFEDHRVGRSDIFAWKSSHIRGILLNKPSPVFLSKSWPYNEFREFSLPIPKVDDVWALHEFTERIRNRVFIPRTVLSRHVTLCPWHSVKMLLPPNKNSRTKEIWNTN